MFCTLPREATLLRSPYGTNLSACAARARLYHLPYKMATFNAKAFEKKLNGMDLSQTSVQTVSLWIIHHKQNIREVIGVWVDMMKKGNLSETHQSFWHVTKEAGRAREAERRGATMLRQPVICLAGLSILYCKV